MAAPRRGPRWPTNKGKCGFDNLSDTWPNENVVSSSPWSSQSNFEPHVSFANSIGCAPRYRGASRKRSERPQTRKRNHPLDGHESRRFRDAEIYLAPFFEVDAASARVVGEPEGVFPWRHRCGPRRRRGDACPDSEE